MQYVQYVHYTVRINIYFTYKPISCNFRTTVDCKSHSNEDTSEERLDVLKILCFIVSDFLYYDLICATLCLYHPDHEFPR